MIERKVKIRKGAKREKVKSERKRERREREREREEQLAKNRFPSACIKRREGGEGATLPERVATQSKKLDDRKTEREKE